MAKTWATTDRTSPDLRAPGWLAHWPIIGIVLILVGSLLFGALTYDVQTHGPLSREDAPLSRTLHNDAAHTPTYVIEYLVFGFFLGKEVVIVIAITLLLYFLHKRFWRELMMVLIGVGGGGALWFFLSRYFDRPRPAAQIGISVSDPSFPSGHTLTSVLCYGLLAYLFVPKMPSRFWKWFFSITMVLIMAFIGFSRLFLGGHYMTDVLAGYGLGLAWAGLVYTLIERFFSRRKNA